jgi:hypothetical protein
MTVAFEFGIFLRVFEVSRGLSVRVRESRRSLRL